MATEWLKKNPDAVTPWLAGVTAFVWLLVSGQGQRWVWTLVQTCLLLGSVFFATGLLGEQIAQQRAELRELRREIDEAASAALLRAEAAAIADSTRDRA